MRDQQHVFMIAVCLLPCLVKASECVVCKHYVLSFTHTHHMPVWENSSRVGGTAVAVCLMKPQCDTTL